MLDFLLDVIVGAVFLTVFVSFVVVLIMTGFIFLVLPVGLFVMFSFMLGNLIRDEFFK